jgi:DNA invertase Pin-like site-specific DNA recombinase
MDYGYARVSTKDQDNHIQREALARGGCDEIVEEEASGVGERPRRAALLAKLRPGDTLTVHRLDRIGRSMTEVVGTIESLTARGVRFRCLAQSIDTADTSPMGTMQLQLLAMFAQFERTLLLERTAAGKARRAAEGKHPGGPPLFGFEADHETINAEEADALHTIARMILVDGLNLSQVAERINDLPDFPRPRRGGRWRVTSLHRALTNPRIEAVIPDHYADLQRVIRHAPGKGQGGGRPAQHLLSGILVCGHEGCGQPLYAAQKGGKRSRTTGEVGPSQGVYRCKASAGSGGRFAGCGQTQVSESRADAWATEAFIAAVCGEDFARSINRRQAELLADDGTTAEELAAWRRRMAELENVMELAPSFAPADAREQHAELRRLVESATGRLMARPNLQALADLPRSEEALQDAWDRWSVTERRAWLRRLVETIVVHPATDRSRSSDVEARMEPRWRV